MLQINVQPEDMQVQFLNSALLFKRMSSIET